ncbi:MAG: transporter [Caldisericaceae bacterium]|nr:transporter [Caldisericaceae bacterium]
MKQPALLLSIFLFLFVHQLFAQYYDAISIDRPGQSNTYTTVKKMRLQIESGFSYISDKNFPENPDLERIKMQVAATTFRFGLTKKFEVRLGSQFAYQRDKRLQVKNSISSIEGVTLGAKFRALESKDFVPDGAFLINVQLPVGSKELISDKVEPAAMFIGSHPLSEAARLEYNLGLTYRDADFMEYFYSMVLSVSFSEQTSAFIEVAAANPEKGNSNQVFDFGLSLLMTRTFIADVYGGKGLNKYGPDWFISFGGGIRLPR